MDIGVPEWGTRLVGRVDGRFVGGRETVKESGDTTRVCDVLGEMVAERVAMRNGGQTVGEGERDGHLEESSKGVWVFGGGTT